MIPIYLDLSGFVKAFSLSKEEVDSFADETLSEISGEFLGYWRKEASVLKSTKKEYLRGLYVDRVSEGIYEVGLKNWLPNAVEQGLSEFDMKQGFQNSSKIKTKKDGGWYLTIPFRFAAPDSLGESEIFAGKLPGKIHNIVKKGSQGNPEYTLPLNEIPEEFRTPKRAFEDVPKSDLLLSQQKSIYEGMQRSDKENHSQYHNFRRVSDTSLEESWNHPGIEARDLANKALSKFENVLPGLVDEIAEIWLENKGL